MPIKARENLIGAWAFLGGLIISLLVGVVGGNNTHPIVLGVLALFGILIGFFVAEKDVQTFLLASVALVIVIFVGIQGIISSAQVHDVKTVLGVNIGRRVTTVLATLLVLIVPSTIVVALKTVFSIAKS